jgi:hypothetical protein
MTIEYLLLLLMIIFWLIPIVIALIRGHHHALPIFIFNLFLGWTGIGWVLALTWACMPVKRRHCATVGESNA